jgi:hypothetical protein
MWCHLICSELTGYKLYLPSSELARQVQCGYGDNDYRLKSSRWCMHGLWVREIPPVHYINLFGGILWLTRYVP